MANLGDKLRNELTLPDWFEDAVVSDLRFCGRSAFVCDRNEMCVSSEGFPIKYEPLLTKWADENGINYSFRTTCNGKIRVIEFTL